MFDIHCHILPDCDDGSASMEESLEMMDAASKVGITHMVCTPHCRDPYFDYDLMTEAFHQLKEAAPGMVLYPGFEVNWKKYQELGASEALADKLSLKCPNPFHSDRGLFLLELSTYASEGDFIAYFQTIAQLQSYGLDVIIAHPERYVALQRNMDLAKRLKDRGCIFQASGDFISGGRLGRERKPALRMIQEGLYDLIGSDAHCPRHYRSLAKALRKFPELVIDLDPEAVQNFSAVPPTLSASNPPARGVSSAGWGGDGVPGDDREPPNPYALCDPFDDEDDDDDDRLIFDRQAFLALRRRDGRGGPAHMRVE